VERQFDHVARFSEQTQEMVADDAFIRSWSVGIMEVTQGSGEVTTIDPASLPGLEVYLRGDHVAGQHGAGAATWAISAATGATPRRRPPGSGRSLPTRPAPTAKRSCSSMG